jgi:hypothetical protein
MSVCSPPDSSAHLSDVRQEAGFNEKRSKVPIDCSTGTADLKSLFDLTIVETKQLDSEH